MASASGHSDGHEGVNSLLDEIDRLVDESLARGEEHCDTFAGTAYRENHPCPWCPEGFHYLPITERMVEMRRGSYAQDEFGQGIVDPDYDYRTDDSGIVCPGSEVHGPPDRYGTWDKQRRERAAQRPSRMGRPPYPAPPSPSLPSGRRRTIRFIGPFEPWTVAIDDERDIEEVVSNPALVGLPGPIERRTMVTAQRLTATFELNDPIRNPSQGWLRENWDDTTGELNMTDQGTFVRMRPIVIPFAAMEVHSADRNAVLPDWVEFETTYPVERHSWFLPYLTVTLQNDAIAHVQGQINAISEQIGHRPYCECPEEGHYSYCHWSPTPPPPGMAYGPPGHETDYVIIDEAYEMSNEEIERLQPYVDQIEEVRTTIAEEAGIPPRLLGAGTTGEAPGELDG